MMAFGFRARAMAGLFLVFCMIFGVHASDFRSSVYVGDSYPEIVSVKTFSYYVSEGDNIPRSSFLYPDPRVVYIQVKVKDALGYTNILNNGHVKVRIVLWDGTSETDFARFGSEYVNASFASGSGTDAIYTYAYTMSLYDQIRLGTESPPLYYRVKAQVYNGVFTVTSNLTSGNADYTYDVPAPPPPQVLFDVTIDVPENKRVVGPGDSFYATVAVTKVSPPGDAEVTMTYRITDPRNRTVDYLTETVAITGSVYRVPVLYIPTDAIEGDYVFRATVSYRDVQSWSEAAFKVRIHAPTTTSTTTTTTTTAGASTTSTGPYVTTTSSTTTSSTTTTVTGRRSGGEGAVVNVPVTGLEMKREISIYKYPAEFYGFKGEAKPMMVVVENTGDLALDDVSVYLGGPVTVTKVVPEKINDMEVGARKIFVLTITLPEDLAAGSYDTTLKAIAQHAADERHVKLIVLDRPYESSREMDLKKKIADLDELVKAIWNEAVEIGIGNEDKNIFEVFRLLKNAKESIEKARNSWMEGRYDTTETALDEAGLHIENSVSSLAVLKSGRKKPEVSELLSTKEITVYTLPPLFWAIAITAIVATLLLAYERSRRNRPGEKLEERYELRRTKDMILGRIRGT